MSSIVISGDTSGAITLAAPSVAGTNTAILPASTGTVMVSGNMPAFSAYASATQSLTGGSFTKITFDIKEFDTNSNYSTSTYRFTPTVAGYYQISSAISIGGVTGNYFISTIYKNGSRFKDGCNYPTSSNAGAVSAVSALIYFNGSTDYVEIYALPNNTVSTSASSAQCYFQAVMVRSA